jgi:hypothetical protein
VTRRQRRLLAVVLLLTLAALAQSAGCVGEPIVAVAGSHYTLVEGRDLLALHPDFTARNAARWRAEAAKAGWRDPLVLGCHGDDYCGQWVFSTGYGRPDVAAVAVIQTVYDLACRERDLLISACNPGAYRLTVHRAPGMTGRVFYVLETKWTTPGPRRRPCGDTGQWEDYAGRICDFVEAAYVDDLAVKPSTRPSTRPTTNPTTRPTP